MTTISVVMPVYNAPEDFFRAAIESILNQTFQDFEFIIIDDASKDYIETIAKSYSDSRLKYYKLEQNQGAANARNTAISKATGKYLAFLDADDVALPTRLEKQYNFLETHPEIGVLGTKTEIIGNDSKEMHFPTPTKHQDIENYLILSGCVFCQSSIMLRKEILDKNNIYYKTEYIPAEDYAFWLDLIGKTKFEVMEDVLVQYRFHEQNISHRQANKQAQKSNEVQFNALKKYCDMTAEQYEVLSSFLQDKTLPVSVLKQLAPILDIAIKDLQSKGFPATDVMHLFKKKFKKLYYHTHGITKQWELFQSPINTLFKLPFYWKLYCFITRGLI